MRRADIRAARDGLAFARIGPAHHPLKKTRRNVLLWRELDNAASSAWCQPRAPCSGKYFSWRTDKQQKRGAQRGLRAQKKRTPILRSTSVFHFFEAFIRIRGKPKRACCASESYTPVETVYRLAKEQGNTFVTITDHNTIDGALELCRLHPDDCFVSTEATAYFPEDGCKVHILCYDITPDQFSVIQRARDNIYNLRDYLRQANIACSVAHATYSVNNKLTLEHIEKLLVLFDVFEGINGTRGQESNRIWQQVLNKISPDDIRRLSAKHHLDPWSAESWPKGQTGGSDDHAGLFAGFTWTSAEAGSKEDYLNALRNRRTTAGGRCGDFKALAYGIYKIASEHVRQKQGASSGLAGLLASILFHDKGPSLRERLFLRKLGFRRSARDQIMSRFLNGLWEITQDATEFGADWQITQAYDALAVLLDELTAEIARSIEQGVKGQSSQDVLQYLSSALPALIFATPFVSTLRILNKNRELNNQLNEAFHLAQRDQRALCRLQHLEEPDRRSHREACVGWAT